MIFNKTTKELYKEASKVALDNAQMLFDEAQLLNREKYHARGFAIGITSLEESVKALLFRAVSVGIFDAEKTRFFLHDHESKLEESGRILSSLAESAELLIGFIEKGKEYGLFTEADLIPEDYKKITELFQSLAKKITKSHNRKLDSFYVDVRGSTILNPNKIIKGKETFELFHIIEFQNGIVEILIGLEDNVFLKLLDFPLVVRAVSKIEEAMSLYFTRRNS